MVTSIFLCILLMLGFKIFYLDRLSIRQAPFAIRRSFSRPTQGSSILLILFFFLVVFFPLFVGMEFYLRSDANVLVVIFFLIWGYQWVKIVWNSQEKFP